MSKKNSIDNSNSANSNNSNSHEAQTRAKSEARTPEQQLRKLAHKKREQ